MNKLSQEVIERLEPDHVAIQRQAKLALQKLNAELKKRRLKAKAIVGGSVAKGTFLSHDHDVDLFVQFSLTEKEKNLSDLLEPAVKAAFPKAERLHGSRDYFRVVGELNFEIVPVLKITKPSQAENVTDCSPLHVQWVKKFPRMRQEIMLAKAFCKAQRVYGAESYIGGFSGHVVDILTIWAKGFVPLLRKAAKWKPPVIIDYYNVHKGKAWFRLNKSKLQSPVIVIDPIQPERNAAAALTTDKFQKFQEAAKAFLKKAGKKFFVQHSVSIEELKKKAKGKQLIVIRLKPLAGKHDVVGAKLLKAIEYCTAQLKKHEFKVLEHDWLWQLTEEAIAWWVLPKKPLSTTMEWFGPPLDKKEHVGAFKKRYPNAKKKGKRLVAVVRREYTTPEPLVRKLLKSPEIQERVRGSSMDVY